MRTRVWLALSHIQPLRLAEPRSEKPGCGGLYIPSVTCFSRPMDPLLKLLQENAKWAPAQLGAMLNLPEPEIASKIKAYEHDQIILGYRTILNEERLGVEKVRA